MYFEHKNCLIEFIYNAEQIQAMLSDFLAGNSVQEVNLITVLNLKNSKKLEINLTNNSGLLGIFSIDAPNGNIIISKKKIPIETLCLDNDTLLMITTTNLLLNWNFELQTDGYNKALYRHIISETDSLFNPLDFNNDQLICK